ncbi:MAG: galactosyltransferase-related protein, partial [Prolixibacteraceae bacterium]|nr:galactosyltransferase-related protein [Prolixibacteraceae bacterium]
YADEIRNKYQLSFINRFKKKNQSKVEVADVSHPDIGRLISLYTYASYTEISDYEQQADDLLDNIFVNISMKIPVCLENGLIGIGCGLIYLIQNNFVEGDEDEILSEIDSCLINKLLFSLDYKDIDWYGFLYYFRLRILYNHSTDRKIYEIIFRQHAIYLLDCLMRSIQTSVNCDKRIIGELEFFHQMKICPTKTSQILSVLTSIVNNQISFIIPIRVDSVERERNLDVVLEQLNEIENVDISILEGDIKPLYRLKKEYSNVTYRFVEDSDPIFYRTKYLNQLLREVQGSIVGIWDADVITSKEQILDAVKKIRSGGAIMSFPYDGRFIMLPPKNSDQLINSGLNKGLKKQVMNRYLAHGLHSVGGAFFVNKKIYLESGGENEYFYGWGPEDAERVKRMEILGYPVYRAKGPLFHLYHPRKENSWYGNNQIEYKNRHEFLKVCSMSKDELKKYIETWNCKPVK